MKAVVLGEETKKIRMRVEVMESCRVITTILLYVTKCSLFLMGGKTIYYFILEFRTVGNWTLPV